MTARLRERHASGVLLAETVASEALAVQLDRPALPIGGRHRRVVAYAEPRVTPARFATLLRELADQLERGDP